MFGLAVTYPVYPEFQVKADIFDQSLDNGKEVHEYLVTSAFCSSASNVENRRCDFRGSA